MSSTASIPSANFGPTHRWRVLGVGVAANACFSAVLAGIPTTAISMRLDYHLDTAAVGFALGLLGLGVAISELPWGVLTDRWGDRRVLLIGLGASTLLLTAMALGLAPAAGAIPVYAALTSAFLLVGVLSGSVNGASGRAVMAWFKEGERGFAMSIRQTAVPVGGGLGALILPSLAATQGFAAVYLALALAFGLSAFFTWLWLHEPPIAESLKPVVAGAPAPSTLRDPTIWRLALAIGLACCPQVAVLSFAALFLHDFSGASLGVISGALLLVQGGAAVSRIWSGRWTDRNRNRRFYLRACASWTVAAFVALAAVVAIASANPNLPATQFAIVALLVVGGVFASAWHGVAYTELATLAAAGRIGTALGLGNTCAFGAFFLTPVAIPLLLKIGAWPLVWLAAAGAALIARLLFPAPRP